VWEKPIQAKVFEFLTMNKRTNLKALGRKRKRSRWPGYKSIGQYFGGRYECDYVSPYSKTAGNFDSEIMIVLQDWSSDNALRTTFHSDCAQYGYGLNVPSNENLILLLKTHYNCSLSDIYGTNLFPFIKLGGMSSSIPRQDLRRAALDFAIPEIKIVRPKLVICLGLATFNAIREACGQEPVYRLAEAIRSPFTLEEKPARRNKIRVWCQAHPGRLGQNMRNRGGRKRVPSDWRRRKMDAPVRTIHATI
jgi:hypothetical protein